jgi:hypothetical protein
MKVVLLGVESMLRASIAWTRINVEKLALLRVESMLLS